MKIVTITGQTATGKTKLALEYAQKYDGELINCDSRQIYKHLDIITGKDLTNKKFHVVKKNANFSIGYYLLPVILESRHSRDDRILKDAIASLQHDEQKQTKIWLYNIVDPKEYFSSFDYQQCALWVIKKILSEGKTPIIVGGTYFYLKHLLYDIETENIPPNWKLREELNYKPVTDLQKIYKRLSLQYVNKLKPLNRSDWNNRQRLIRKIEIETYYRHSGKSRHGRDASRIDSGVASSDTVRYLTSLPRMTLNRKLRLKSFQIEFVGLKFKEKDKLRKAIETRVEERLKHGAIEEVQSLLKMGYKETDPGLKTIGYQQILAHLKGSLTKDEAITQWINKEIQYAKRQYTFMKKDKNIKWVTK